MELPHLLNATSQALNNYVVLPSEEANTAITLWIAATHTVNAQPHATRLCINSPEKRCGKSRLLDIVAGLCHNPVMTVSATSNVIFRLMDQDTPPTLLIDEADTLFGTKKAAEHNEALRGLLNAGFQRGRDSHRCVGPTNTPTAFSAFGFAALAGIGDLPDTITDRAINVTLRRRHNNEHVQPFRAKRDGDKLIAIQEGYKRWAPTALDDIATAVTELPVEDRAADTWEPLITIADLASHQWPHHARQACITMTAQDARNDADNSHQVRLLKDIKHIFERSTHIFINSVELLGMLHSMSDSDWESQLKSGRTLARKLKHFDIRPKRDPTGKHRGYYREDFQDTFSRYIP